jgi:hypothetical protein
VSVFIPRTQFYPQTDFTVCISKNPSAWTLGGGRGRSRIFLFLFLFYFYFFLVVAVVLKKEKRKILVFGFQSPRSPRSPRSPGFAGEAARRRRFFRPSSPSHPQGCHNGRFWMKITVRTSADIRPRSRLFRGCGFTRGRVLPQCPRGHGRPLSSLPSPLLPSPPPTPADAVCCPRGREKK